VVREDPDEVGSQLFLSEQEVLGWYPPDAARFASETTWTHRDGEVFADDV
jgi:hypothetical protein